MCVASSAGAGPELHRAADSGRDQSYFLFATTHEQLAFLRFPLGGLPRARRAPSPSASSCRLPTKPDSQDICFVPSGSYANVIAKLRPGAAEPGEVVDEAGRVLGRHDGVIHFTVGQRRGLGIAAAEPLYVLRLEPERCRVVVGPHAALGRRQVRIGGMNWLGPPVPAEGMDVQIKLRSTQPPAAARLFIAEGRGEAVLEEPLFGVAPGQACVAYDGTRVLGGGWIRREPPFA